MAKSIYIMLYVTFVMVMTVMGIQALFDGEAFLPWVAILLTCAPMALFLARVMILQNTARTSANLLFITILAVGGAGLGSALALFDFNGFLAPSLAVAGCAFLLIYTLWYSVLDRSESQLSTGETLPAFNLQNSDGAAIASDSFKGSATILIFYRGNWCPLCVAQVKEMAAAYNDLKEQGARVIFVSPQPQGHTRSLAKKFGASGLEFLRDEDNVAAKSLGIFSKFGTPMGMQALGYDSDTVLPTVIICDTAGEILWTHETDNYRVRPEPATYQAVLNGTYKAVA